MGCHLIEEPEKAVLIVEWWLSGIILLVIKKDKSPK